MKWRGVDRLLGRRADVAGGEAEQPESDQLSEYMLIWSRTTRSLMPVWM
jgi:hypothetical protein